MSYSHSFSTMIRSITKKLGSGLAFAFLITSILARTSLTLILLPLIALTALVSMPLLSVLSTITTAVLPSCFIGGHE